MDCLQGIYRTLLKCANLGSRREPCANLGSRRELKIISQVRAPNHCQKLVSGANQKNFHRFVPRTIFKTLLVARTKNIFTSSRRELFSKIYLWCEPKFLSQVRAANHFQKSVCAANQKYFHRFAVQT